MIQLRDEGAETKVKETRAVVAAHEALTAEELAQFVGISVILAKERYTVVFLLYGVCYCYVKPR